MKRALVLSGGGSKGAFEVGAIDYLVNTAGMNFNIFIGTSVGALNAAFLGQARNHKELAELSRDLIQLWLSMKGSRSVYKRSFWGVLRLFFYDSLYQPSGLNRILKKQINLQRVFDSATVVKVAAVAQETGLLFYADSRRSELQADFLKYVLASASMPVFFPAVRIGENHWYDGGLRDITPLGAAFNEKPDEIMVITTFPVGPNLEPVLPPRKHHGAFQAILRTIEILTSEIQTNDLQLANSINLNHRSFPGQYRIPIRLIAPKNSLPGKDVLEFNQADIAENIRLGCEAAQKPRLLSIPKISSHSDPVADFRSGYPHLHSNQY
jgi:NTE family protein